MNANELAQYLEVAFYPDEDIFKAATMLRQQQAEIEALKANLEHAHGIGEAGGFIKGHKAALEKTLTEDEIKEVADSVCHKWKKNGVGELYMEDFARAILRKANEK